MLLDLQGREWLFALKAACGPNLLAKKFVRKRDEGPPRPFVKDLAFWLK